MVARGRNRGRPRGPVESSLDSWGNRRRPDRGMICPPRLHRTGRQWYRFLLGVVFTHEWGGDRLYAAVDGVEEILPLGLDRMGRADSLDAVDGSPLRMAQVVDNFEVLPVDGAESQPA